MLGPAAPLAACAKWRLSVAKCRFGIAGWHFLAAKGTNFGAIMYRLATVFRLASVRPPHRVYRVRQYDSKGNEGVYKENDREIKKFCPVVKSK